MKAQLILENGKKFEGRAFGYKQESVGELVFTTGMTGYQEVLTDPSYHGQIVTFTYPLIGNYGINLEDIESATPHPKALIVREKANYPSNWRCEMGLEGYLKHHKIMGIEALDTRELTKIIRDQGTMKAIITLRELTESQIAQKLNQFNNIHAVDRVTTSHSYEVLGEGKHVAIIDFGVKENILRSLQLRNCKITVFPARAKVKEVLSINPDGILLSNGPGDPEDLMDIADNIRTFVETKPVFGICLGHQILNLALGGSSKKMTFGHRGCNHPVKDLQQGKVYITSQNHGYVVNEVPETLEITHINLNDQSVEGLRHRKHPAFSVQFHPEASPGPQETKYLFDEFMNAMKGGQDHA
ncbi:carbamoyl phosphate synthase small subunit [Tindallia californiensis]|uniref:Carbamoyl phosphate synthase small chain n=1 Tax=Tindallia californiensis TaxID=159292 RepID=A0A1H3R2R1_9FIRM|nr:carbamoyl phosphate synthase small subunit [Tindallia californiensis]SDZ19803.1 carbamoyl-phosphate synthase small subunit [Tindallia californiensis]